MPSNLLNELPLATEVEHFQTLLTRPGLRIERIVSDGQVSPPGFWYEQAEDEWLLLLAGQTVLEYEDGQQVALVMGDTLLIPAACRHRVVFTAPRSVWLAVFCTAEVAAAR
ncbi:cupin domain-containing protein [Uliginosibacterium sp. TH139]|uniref:cupin domain-containing protein n=1 Tax=Uliginosibacterium sp. TH139 TaxID=2067453 RepID=UPI000C7BB4B6|nr:cupin domain-containing protein [Uliginosibacterium sp. TH139]PLK50457.1 hypothetical protein C0V76_01110 [Uliginosibacterium sp. TH139]